MRIEAHAEQVERRLRVSQFGGGAGGVTCAAGFFYGGGSVRQQLCADIRRGTFDSMRRTIGLIQRAVSHAIVQCVARFLDSAGTLRFW